MRCAATEAQSTSEQSPSCISCLQRLQKKMRFLEILERECSYSPGDEDNLRIKMDLFMGPLCIVLLYPCCGMEAWARMVCGRGSF